MGHAMFWFSGTGNSRSVAHGIATILGDTIEVPMVTAKGNEAIHAGTIGFAFPVYYFGLPLYVVDFLARVELPPDAHIYTVATMANSPGIAHGEARAILGQRGSELSAGWSVKMPGNYTPFYGAPSQHSQDRCFVAAAERAAEIAEAVRERRSHALEDARLPMRLVAPLARAIARKRIPRRDHVFAVGDHCTSCGTCEQVCPVQNVKLVDGRPAWHGHCQECMACLQWCPVEAIEAGWITRGRERYRHPDFSAADFMLRRDSE